MNQMNDIVSEEFMCCNASHQKSLNCCKHSLSHLSCTWLSLSYFLVQSLCEISDMIIIFLCSNWLRIHATAAFRGGDGVRYLSRHGQCSIYKVLEQQNLAPSSSRGGCRSKVVWREAISRGRPWQACQSTTQHLSDQHRFLGTYPPTPPLGLTLPLAQP